MLHCVLDEAVLLAGPRRLGGHARATPAPGQGRRTTPPDRPDPALGRQPVPVRPFSLATVDDGEVGLIETPVRDIVTNSREDIAGLTAAWEAVRTFALSQRDSTELIQQIADERWS